MEYITQGSWDKIQTLHPKIRQEVLDAVVHVNEFILPKGVRMGIVQALRTFKEQHTLFLQRPKVTQADAGQSHHNYGLAFDFAILIDKDGDGNFEQVSWMVDQHWLDIATYFKSLGYSWGGDWKFVDKPHLEKLFGHTWRDLLPKYNKRDWIPGTTYVNI